MKKILLIVLLLITINKINSQNLLSNPSFDGTYGTTAEYAGCAPSYFYNPNWGVSPASSVVFSKNTNSTYDHTHLNIPTSLIASQKVVVTNINGYCYFAQPFKVKGKRVLKASIWVKPILAAAGEQKIELMIRSRRQYNPSVTAKEVTLKGSDWQQIEIEGTTGCLVNDNNVYIYDFFINFKTPTSTPQTLYLDDASVTDVTNNQNIQNNLIENSSFEGTYGTTAEYTGCAPSYYYNPNWNAIPVSSSVIFSKDTINSLSGRACQKVVVNSINSYCYFAQGFNIAQKQKLKASIWIKPSADANLDFALRSDQTYNPDIARIHCNSSSNSSSNGLTLIPNKWQKVEIYGDTGTLVDNTSGKNLYLFIDLKSAGTIYLEGAVVTNVTTDVTDVDDTKLTNIENALPNLLINPDFEDDFVSGGAYNGIASPFFYNPNWATGQTASATFSKENCTPQKGLSCQKIVITSKPTFCYYEQTISVKGSRIFKASVWVKSPDNVEIDFTLRSPDGNKYYAPIYSARTLKVDAEWQKIEIIGGMGSLVGEDETYNLNFHINFRSTGTLYIDNASVVDVTDIIKNKSISNSTQAEAIPKSFFGMHINKLGAHDVWPPVDFGTLRLWDTGTKWSEIQPTQNQWEILDSNNPSINRLKLYVDKRDASDASCNIMYTLGMPAAWASTDNSTPFLQTGAYRSVKKLSDWTNYVTKVGNQYKGKIKYWEIWNEVGVFFDRGVLNDGISLNALSESAYDILKGIDSTNVVLSPNFTTSTSASDFLYKCNGTYKFDVFSFHMYTSKKPENDIGVFYGYRNLLNNFGLNDKPIWNTEGSNTSGFDNTTGYDIERAGAVSRAYIIQWLYDVKNFNWYFWEPYNDTADLHGDWAKYGTTLSSSNSGTISVLTSSGKAYKKVVKWLVGKRMIAKKIDTANNWIITIYNPTTLKNEFIVWNPSTSPTNNTITIPDAWGTTFMYNLINDNLDTVSTVTPNAAPILLTPANNNVVAPVTRQSNNEFVKNDNLDKYLIYPNPANNYLIIQKKELDNIDTAKLYDLNGRLILDNIILNNETNKINIENILKGIYILEIQNEKQARYNYKVIIENR